jgi:predicted cupin superfamily sugar epimerase
MPEQTIQQLIDQLHLETLPVEGTLFKNTYRSTQTNSKGEPLATCMIGLLCHQPLSLSRFHRLTHDEIWHCYGGDPFSLYLLYPEGHSTEIVMGTDLAAGQQLQAVVPAGTWQAARLCAGGTYAIFGCTMAPGFTGACFEGGTIEMLMEQYPERDNWIRELAVHGQETKMPEGFVG